MNLALTTRGGIVPRQYQIDALNALDAHICTRDDNPCVVIPTGGGKSILMAWAIQQWKLDFPAFRVVILAHRSELVKQNAAELAEAWPQADIGIYAAGLGRKDQEHSILFASIDSIWKRWGEFTPFDCIIVDEAHRLPAAGEGKYREFIKGCRICNKNIRVIGFTATPFRMNCGPICHNDHILNKVCYEANIGDLISQGFLSMLRSKVGETPDLSEVKRNSGGDYVITSLSKATNLSGVVAKAVNSAMKLIIQENRQSCVWFCVDVKHCHAVSAELRKYGVDAPVVTAKTSSQDRKKYAEGFVAGRYKHLVNINVYTEGFNAKRIDCIVLLRPTLSKGLYSQMVGRGLRTFPGKDFCLILDFAHCIEEHGPIDCLDAGEVRIIECQECHDVFSRAIRSCPHCGWEIPKREVEREAAEIREKRMHDERVSQAAILGSMPEDCIVDEVTVARHSKQGSPDSIRVCYRCGLSVFSEWICPDHEGYARTKAIDWWISRFGRDDADKFTVDWALSDMFLGQRIKDLTVTVTVVRRGKYQEIIRHGLKHNQGS